MNFRLTDNFTHGARGDHGNRVFRVADGIEEIFRIPDAPQDDEIRIHDIFIENNYACEVLAASFKNTQQLLELCEYGVGGATAAPDILNGLLTNRIVTDAVKVFNSDFAGLVGQGVTMAD